MRELELNDEIIVNSLNIVLRLDIYCVSWNVIHIRVLINNAAENFGMY